ncbi:MAG: hypothetical protein KGK01_02750, partial [Bradyrhizobium sp.]|nr:hypothetical protein [Bradyrhizobium sp.]
MRPTAAAGREAFAAIAFEAAIDLRLRSGDERRQPVDADIRLGLGLRLRLILRLRAMLAILVVLSRQML